MNNSILKLLQAAIKYDASDPKRIHHLIKVHSFAAAIGTAEGLNNEEMLVLEAAAVLHDIGIHRAEEIYDKVSGRASAFRWGKKAN